MSSDFHFAISINYYAITRRHGNGHGQSQDLNPGQDMGRHRERDKKGRDIDQKAHV